jgi:hypothetical protein
MAEDWSAWTNPGSGLLGNPWQYIGDLGAGLLANSGPSFEPQGGFGPRLGRGMQYANAMQGERTMNDARRQAMAMEAKEMQGMSLLQAWMAEHTDATPQEQLQAAMQFMPQTTLKGMVTNMSNPLLTIEALRAKTDLEAAGTKSQADALELEKDYTALRGNYTQQYAARTALDYLASVPGAEALLNSPTITGIATTGQGAVAGIGGFLQKGLEAGGELLYGIPKAEQKKVLSAIYTVKKAMDNISTNTQRAVASQALGREGLVVPHRCGRTSSTGCSMRHAASGTNKKWSSRRSRRNTRGTRGAAAGLQRRGDASGYATTTPTHGVQNGQLVEQPPTQISPPAAQAGAAPAPKATGSLTLNAQGIPTFKREADMLRAEQNGWLKGYKSIELNGKIYDWVE